MLQALPFGGGLDATAEVFEILDTGVLTQGITPLVETLCLTLAMPVLHEARRIAIAITTPQAPALRAVSLAPMYTCLFFISLSPSVLYNRWHWLRFRLYHWL
jgi:hypothetical protein